MVAVTTHKCSTCGYEICQECMHNPPKFLMHPLGELHAIMDEASAPPMTGEELIEKAVEGEQEGIPSTYTTPIQDEGEPRYGTVNK